MRVNLVTPGITLTEEDDSVDQNYCGECSIY
jgi:hypothetical protein